MHVGTRAERKPAERIVIFETIARKPALDGTPDLRRPVCRLKSHASPPPCRDVVDRGLWREEALHSRSSLVIALLASALLLRDAAAQAPTVDTTGASRCKVRGFSTDTDPKGTNVRSAPRADASVIGHLAPRTRISPDDYTGVTFEIVGSKDGWLLIQNADPEAGLKLNAANAAGGRGWISGRLVGTTLASEPLRAGPQRDMAIVAYLSGATWGPDSVAVSVVHACQDEYIEVTATPISGKPLRGWSWRPCSSQLTTCDRSDRND